jgi:hypothetical protein
MRGFFNIGAQKHNLFLFTLRVWLPNKNIVDLIQQKGMSLLTGDDLVHLATQPIIQVVNERLLESKDSLFAGKPVTIKLDSINACDFVVRELKGFQVEKKVTPSEFCFKHHNECGAFTSDCTPPDYYVKVKLKD